MQPTQESHSIYDRIFERLEKLLSDRKNPGSAFQKLSRNFRAGLTIATAAYFIFLLVLIFLLNWWGERNWFLSILLFVPAVIWLVPLLLLTPFHLLVRPKLCWITASALLVVCFIYLDFHWAFSADETKSGLTLLSNNIGGRKFQTFIELVEKENPDIIAMQDTGRFVGLKERYPERFFSKVDEYILISKIPIRRSGLISELRYRGQSIGSWHELQYEDQSIVVYNIHMPTPRIEFTKLRGRGLLAEIIGGKGIYSSETRKDYRQFMEEKSLLTHNLAEFLRKEQRPFLVAGDFNMSSHGYHYDLLKPNLNDAFAEKGRGYGSTFPGVINGWLNLFGSWLRLDYLFSGKNWQTHWCRVEPHGLAEHRAVIARFELKPKANKP